MYARRGHLHVQRLARRLLRGDERGLLDNNDLARRNVARGQHADAAAVRGPANARGVAAELHDPIDNLGEAVPPPRCHAWQRTCTHTHTHTHVWDVFSPMATRHSCTPCSPANRATWAITAGTARSAT